MPELPDISQDFLADTSAYVSGLQAAIDAAERFRDVNLEAVSSIDMIREAAAEASGNMSGLAGADGEAASAAGHLRDEMATLEDVIQHLDDQTVDLMGQTQVLRGGFMDLDEKLDDLIGHVTETNTLLGAMRDELFSVAASSAAAAAGMRSFGASSAQAATEANAAAAATDKVSSAQRHGIGWFRLTSDGWHWLLTGMTEYLAVAIPGTIALGAAMAVMASGAIDAFDHIKDLYDVTDATKAMLGQTTGSVLGLSGAFGQASEAAKPAVYEALGNVLDLLKERTGGLATAGLDVAHAFDEFTAKLTYDFGPAGPLGKGAGLMAEGKQDLVEFGQILGNLGHALDNFAADAPGVAEMLLSLADAASKVVVVISELPAPLITAFMAFHEFQMWGGLASSILGHFGAEAQDVTGGTLSMGRAVTVASNLFKAVPMIAANAVQGLGNLVSGYGHLGVGAAQAGAKIRNVGEDMESSITAIPAWEAALGALAAGGLAVLIYKLATAKDAAQQMGDSMQQAVTKAKNVQEFALITSNMVRLTTAGNQAAASVKHLSAEIQSGADVANRSYVGSLGDAQQAQTQLSDSMKQQNQDMASLFQGSVKLSNQFGGSLSQSMALADLAGVNLSTTTVKFGRDANKAGIQIEGLVAGYQAMGQTGGLLGNDMNAISVEAGVQNTKVSQLNQAWDQFLSNATSLTSSFTSLITDVGEISNAVTTSGKAFDTFGGKAVSSTTAAAESMQSFTGTGAQVWQNYDQALQQAGTYTDSLRTASAYGAVSQKQFTESVAYTVQQLLPYAKYSGTAAEELSALAQQAGETGGSYKDLQDWVKANTTSTSNFNKIMQQETGQLSDVSSAAQQFASTLQSDLINAMVSAGMKFSTVNNLISSYAKMISQGDADTAKGRSDRAQLIHDLENVGMNAKQAAAMVKLMAGEIAGLHNKTVNVMVNGELTGPAAGILANQGISNTTILGARQAGAHAAAGSQYTPGGSMLVGEQGPEIVHLPAGSAVTPSYMVPGMDSGQGGGSMTVHSHVYLDGNEIFSNQQDHAFAFNRRNGPSVTGSFAPPS